MTEKEKTSFMVDFRNAVEEIENTTRRKEPDLAMTWDTLRWKWLDHYIEDIPEEFSHGRSKLLLARWFQEYFRTLIWLEWIVHKGGYYHACRELRCMLEAVIQAFYIDSKYQQLGVEAKIAVLNEMYDVGRWESFGTGIINRAKLPRQKEIVDLYKELSSFTHPSSSQLEHILELKDTEEHIQALTKPEFNRDLLVQCCNLSEKVTSHIIEINRRFVRVISLMAIFNKLRQELDQESFTIEHPTIPNTSLGFRMFPRYEGEDIHELYFYIAYENTENLWFVFVCAKGATLKGKVGPLLKDVVKLNNTYSKCPGSNYLYCRKIPPPESLRRVVDFANLASEAIIEFVMWIDKLLRAKDYKL